MKLFSLIILLTVLACSEKEVQKTSNIPQTEVSQTTKTTSVAEANKFESWVEFYKNDNPEFSLEGLNLLKINLLTYNQRPRLQVLTAILINIIKDF